MLEMRRTEKVGVNGRQPERPAQGTSTGWDWQTPGRAVGPGGHEIRSA